MIADALLFDLDGTLTDPKPGIVGSLRFALDQLGVSCPSDDVLATFIGPPLRGTFASLLETSETFRIEEAMRCYRQRFASTGLYENQVYAGIPIMLERAQQASTAMYVATSKPRVYAERIVQHFGLDHRFRQVYGPELDGQREHKADLLAYLLASEGVAPQAAVMIGDREADVHAARANGVRSIGVLWGYGSAQELLDAGVDLLCETPAELAAQLSATKSN
ncbi:MAG TPA: HAD hydrolase-like protein [Pyrinomonadaceae bacterium]